MSILHEQIEHGIHMGWLASQFELSHGGASASVRAMEGMRGFAVFLVFLVHYITLAAPWITPDSTLSQVAGAVRVIGNSGVDIFFFLSGYLIYGSLMARKQAFLPFMRRRISRIYPTFCVVFAGYLALSCLHPAESRIPAPAFEAGLYILQNFLLLPGLFPIRPIITVAWSLSYEMFFYLALPLTLYVFRVRDRSPRWRVRFFLGIAAAITIYSVAFGGHVRFIMFMAGILLYDALKTRPFTLPRNWFAAAALAVGLLATVTPTGGAAAFAIKLVVLAAALFVTCYCCFTGPDEAVARAFSWTPLRWLGNISYSYYLLHGLALKAAFAVLHAALPAVAHQSAFFLLLLPVMFAVTLAPSIALFILVERPFSLDPFHRAPVLPVSPAP